MTEHTHLVSHGVAEPARWCAACAAETVTPEGEEVLTRFLEQRLAERTGTEPEETP